MSTPIDPSYRLIPLTQGQWAIVDIEDYDFLMQWKWYARFAKCTGSYYASRSAKNGESSRGRMIHMHRVILGLSSEDPRMPDHRFRNTLDNRKFIGDDENLRVSTKLENNRNASTRRDNTSGFKGVNFHKCTQKWASAISVNKKRIHLGLFATKELAYGAYCQAALRYHGEFARVA